MDLFEKVRDFILNYKVNLILWITMLLVIILSNCIVYFVVFNKVEDINVIDNITTNTVPKEEVKEEDPKVYKIDIKGAIKNPGVYQLNEGSRVIDAVKIAGGVTEFADTSVNNLSKHITDEMVIVIYTADEVSKFKEIKAKEELEDKACQQYNEVINNNSCIDSSSNTDDNPNMEIDTKISINTASIDLLMTLPGIGEAKAKNIISYREKEGKFQKIEDIMNISGIGESVFEKIKDYITI